MRVYDGVIYRNQLSKGISTFAASSVQEFYYYTRVIHVLPAQSAFTAAYNAKSVSTAGSE